jgi:hypothetical protein
MNQNLPMTAPPLDLSASGVWKEMQDFAQREPFTALAAVASLGLLLKLLPNRRLVTTGSAVGAAQVRPAILSLAVSKGMEMCFATNPRQPRS